LNPHKRKTPLRTLEVEGRTFMEAVTLRGVDRGSWHIIVGIDGEVDYSIK